MAKRKYTRGNETPKAYKCTKKNCGWEGDQSEWVEVPRPAEPYMRDLTCPKCGNNEFRGLL
ncbi:hypothetical protein [Myroides odoratimimus]|uniref:Rubredoxin-like domain-containing protein n=1 Tax=Myroides odoratimimus CIP 101113 TaxID=883154 RepID=A0AAV3F5I5_9FLAO|nr:hypothetical protein [Myroides odoratimimus]EHO13826.1 hypothetical protein HMPREF9715_00900 [Myroides odoratimimus CIP 101113]